jgi:CxxC motif-containing protein
LKNEKEITCIVCPIGCKIKIKIKESSCEVVEGHICKKGFEYAQYEALNPQRMLTSSILVKNGIWPLVSVKSSQPIPKNKVLDVLKQIKKTTVNAPVKSGQILIKNVAQTGSDIITTKAVHKK